MTPGADTRHPVYWKFQPQSHPIGYLSMPRRKKFAPAALTISLALLAPPLASAQEKKAPGPIEGEMAGYLLVPHEKVPETYNAGFSMYVAAWPLLDRYPGNRFQTGLLGTWMFAQYPPPKPKELYSDIEGGLGWWRDTRFATETPKFIMGGVTLNFNEWANGPGAGKSRNWDKPLGVYGVAQLSPWVLWPPDGLNLKQGTSGELFGYGYLPLPLTNPKTTTAGKPVPTGDQSWTLFLNTGNFKGPVSFFTPYYWSSITAQKPEHAGKFLDTRPSEPNKAIQMETQYVPSYQATDSKGVTWARIAPTAFPGNSGPDSMVVHRVTAYDRSALWNSVKSWFDGGPAASGTIDTKGSSLHTFNSKGGSTWRIYPPNTPREQKVALAWNSFAKPVAIDQHTYGYRWNSDMVTRSEGKGGSLVTLPQYFRLVEDKDKGRKEWVVAKPAEVPPETGLATVEFQPKKRPRPEPYVTPDDPQSPWRKPGPAAGPFQATLGDGSVVTYHWYRFADQPALLHADLTPAEREQIQSRVEKLHRAWTRDREYLPPPAVGKLADLDPALLVTPPKGMEAGFVPIVTRQAPKAD